MAAFARRDVGNDGRRRGAVAARAVRARGRHARARARADCSGVACGRAAKCISFGPITEKNIEQIRKLNLAVFPVRYNDKFYTDLASSPTPAFNQMGARRERTPGTVRAAPRVLEGLPPPPPRAAYFNDVPVGNICCRRELPDGPKWKLYIMTICVLAPYRRLGVGSRLLELILKEAAGQADLAEIFLHMQVNNADAIAFYEKFGFVAGEEVQDYYKRIDPPHAVVLRKVPPFDAW